MGGFALEVAGDGALGDRFDKRRLQLPRIVRERCVVLPPGQFFERARYGENQRG